MENAEISENQRLEDVENSRKKSGRKSKKEKRKFAQCLKKITSYEWEKWGLTLPLCADGPPSRPLNSAEIGVVDRHFERVQKNHPKFVHA